MKENMHSAVKSLKNDFQKGKMTRREFIRFTTLLGVSAAAAAQMAGFALPVKALAGSVKRGGTLKVAAPVHKVTHPAQFSWISPTNQMRQVAEYLTYTDGDNITHPYLLENWQTSDDLKTWTLNLRKGIKHNNGDDFNADDYVYFMPEATGPCRFGMYNKYQRIVLDSFPELRRLKIGALTTGNSYSVQGIWFRSQISSDQPGYIELLDVLASEIGRVSGDEISFID